MFYQEKEVEFLSQQKPLSLLNVSFKDKDVFPVSDTEELVLHTEAYKGYVRTELVTVIECWMPHGYAKKLRRNRRTSSVRNAEMLSHQ